MTYPGHFPTELANWLSTLDLQCKFAPSPNPLASVLHISKNEKVTLVLMLIELEKWREHSGEWEQCRQWFNEVRSEQMQCIVIWEDYWITKKEIVQSRLRALLSFSQTIPARLTQIVRLDQQEADIFLQENHLNGPAGLRTKYGLVLPERYYRVLPENFNHPVKPGMLVAVATFSNARTFEKEGMPFKSFELIRFASLLGLNVVGGLDKLIKKFVREKQPGDIMSYADIEWSNGRSYEKLGFEEISRTDPKRIALHQHTFERKPIFKAQPFADSVFILNMGSIKFVKTFQHQ